MADIQETIADIIVEMRDLGKLDEKSVDKIPRTLMALGLRTYADRLEAAWKREKAEAEANALAVGGMVEASRATSEKSSTVGDCAKLREALKTVKRYLDGYTVNVLEMRSQVDAALAKPWRNCEVGTDNEQIRRWKEFCDHHEVDRSPESFARWAQGPYFEEGGAK